PKSNRAHARGRQPTRRSAFLCKGGDGQPTVATGMSSAVASVEHRIREREDEVLVLLH
ncbi:unnamed protein product, partial [Scytosiphon promiscuus]